MASTDLISFQLGTPAVPEALAAPAPTVKQVWSILRVYWRRSSLIALAVAAAVTAITLALPKTYTASSMLMVKYEVNDPLGGKEFPVELLGNYMATQVELLHSPQVLIPVIDRLKLRENRRYIAGFHGNAAGDPSGLNEWIVQNMEKKLQVDPGTSGGQLISVSYSSSDPVEAAQVANTIVAVYLEQSGERLNGPANEQARRYALQLADLKDKVDHAQDEVTRFRQENGLLNEGGNTGEELAMLNALQQKLTDAQAARREAEARAGGAASASEAVMGSTLVQGLKTQLAAQEARMAELRTTLGPNHPDVLQLQSQMDATRAALEGSIHSYSDSASSDLAQARQLEAKSARAVEEQHARVVKLQSLQDQAARLQLELDSAEVVYKRALDGYDQVLAASTGRYTNANVVYPAPIPVKASKPKVLKNIAAGIVLGILFGFGGALVYELFNRRVRCRDDIERAYKLPVLAEFAPMAALRSMA